MIDFLASAAVGRPYRGRGEEPTPRLVHCVFFPDRRCVLSVPSGAYGTTETRTASCDEGEYVQGLSYSVYRPEDATSFSYYLTDVGLMCSSATLGERVYVRGSFAVH